MKNLLNDILKKPSEKPVTVNFEEWFKALSKVSKHLSHVSPAMDFETVSRHAADAICQGLSPLQPIAAHFHIDVSVSHLWLPDPSFKLDAFYRIQNRILMPSQTKPVETTREDIFKTHVIVPFEMHKHAIEILIYHKEQNSGPNKLFVDGVQDAFSQAMTQILALREEHMSLKESWEKQSERMLRNRLSAAIYQVQSPFLFAQTLRAFSLPSLQDSSEQSFLYHNPTLDTYRFVFFKFKMTEGEGNSRSIAVASALAAQLRYFEHTAALTSFHDFTTYFSQCIASLSHLITGDDLLSFVLAEFSQKTGQVRWHVAGLPPPIVFGRNSSSVDLPGQTVQPTFRLHETHDWQAHQQIALPAECGLFFFTDNVQKRLQELNLSAESFFERLRPSSNAANILIEAERLLSRPDSARVVSASVTDWNKLAYDISLLSIFNGAGPFRQN